MEPIWESFLTARDRLVFKAAGWGAVAGYNGRPALLVIDINEDFLGDRPEPILDSIRRFPYSCGEAGWQAMERLIPALTAARSKGIPVIYSTSDQCHAFLDRTSWGVKNRRTATRLADRSTDRTSIPAPIAPQAGDILIRKKKPSVFFGTPFLQYLIALGVDQLICCGCTTSGCIRATVIDAFSHNLRVAVLADCTFDRGEASHAMNLFEMQQKYADIITAEELCDYLASLADGLFPNLQSPLGEG